MEELQKTAGTSMEDKPRKVRFKLASSYSGRVLKHVYEDGQELDCPEEQYPHSFIQSKMEMGDACGLEDQQEPSPPRGLTAQRINVYRGVTGCNSMAFGDLSAGGDKGAVLDFGKIIIYTSNLKIIRAPHRRGESGRSPHRSRERKESVPRCKSRGEGKYKATRSKPEEPNPIPEQKEASCEHCGGSGSAPCSLCHGSKLSMLVNRFNESIRELRCPACNPHGQERCQSCTH